MKENRPKIALTLGEPAGIGPDLAVRMTQQTLNCQLVVVGDPHLLRARADELALPINLSVWPEQERTNHITVLQEELLEPVTAGRLNPANADYVLRCLNRAVDGCLRGEFDAMVTGPVHKGIINDAGFSFSGHTEYIANRTGSELAVMMLTTHSLRVALATTHVPLRKVSAMITRQRIEKVLDILIHSLSHRFGIDTPRVAVCGLNPHAGEQGYLGHEEEEAIVPVIRKYQKAGYAIVGPVSADTIFIDRNLDRFDAVLTMYHDQGLPVIKHHGFSEAVNVTLGIPIIRTSVDHGTALDLAGSNNVDIGSSTAAVALAVNLARQQAGIR